MTLRVVKKGHLMLDSKGYSPPPPCNVFLCPILWPGTNSFYRCKWMFDV
jgi:hypothetical protein